MFGAANNNRPAINDGPILFCLMAVFLERVDDVKQRHTVARLLHISQHATAAINDSGFCHFAVINCIGGADILRPNDTGNGQFTHLEINPNLLAAPND
jgi:hypothetical protein